MQIVGEGLGLSRAFYFQVERDDEDWVHVIESEYGRDPGQPSMIGRHSLKLFGSGLFEGLTHGRVLQVSDVAAQAGLTLEELARYRTRKVAAFVNVPLLRNGEYSAGITAHEVCAPARRFSLPAERSVSLVASAADALASARH